MRMLWRGGRGLLLGLAAAAAAAAAAARWLGWWSGRAGLRLFVPEELARYRGGPGDPGLYLALLGRVYDVSSGRRHYEPGAHYSGFAGTSGPALGLRGAPLRASGPPGSRQPGAPRPTLLFPSALRDVGWRDGPPACRWGRPAGLGRRREGRRVPALRSLLPTPVVSRGCACPKSPSFSAPQVSPKTGALGGTRPCFKTDALVSAGDAGARAREGLVAPAGAPIREAARVAGPERWSVEGLLSVSSRRGCRS